MQLISDDSKVTHTPRLGWVLGFCFQAIRLFFKEHFLKSFSREKLRVPVLLEVIVVMTVSSVSDTFPQYP